MTRRAWIGALSLVALATLTNASGALGDRAPTKKERTAIARVLDLPAKCTKIRVSAVTGRANWASLYWKPGPGCQRYAADGVVVLKKRGHPRRWRMVTAGSDFDCPTLYRDVPKKVARDLGIPCHPPL